MRTKTKMRMVAGLLLALLFGPPAKAGTVMRVNDEPVSREEFLWFMEQERPAVFQFFYEHYRLADGTNFWHEVRGQTTPKQLLRHNTVQRLIREKVEQKVFLTFGLTTNISYPVMLDQLAEVNQERRAADRLHHVLYGPVTYSQLMFYANWKSSLQLRAREKLADGQLKMTDRDLKRFYSSNKQLFRSPEKWNLEIFSITHDSASTNQTNSINLELAAKDVFQRAKAGQGADQILQAGGYSNGVKVLTGRYDDLTGDRLGELFSDDKTFQQVRRLKAGRSLRLPSTAGRIQVVRCDTKIPAGYRPFEQVKEQVKRRYVAAQYDEWIITLAKSARVEVNQKELDALLP